MGINRKKMDAIQTDSVIYRILKQASLNISGGIFTAGERPDNSTSEDIVLNNISFEHSTPKRGITNINIHVPDIAVEINGYQQFKADRERLQQITNEVATIIETTTIEGVGLHIETTQLFAEQTAHEHYMNIRCAWLIAKPYTSEIDVKENPLLQRISNLEQRVQTLEQLMKN